MYFFNFEHLRNYTSMFKPHLRHKFHAPSPSLPPLIFSYLQALIHGFLWWWACSWLIFSLKWYLQSPFLLLYSIAIDLQEAKDSIDEDNPRPTSSIWSYIRFPKVPLSFLNTWNFPPLNIVNLLQKKVPKMQR